MHSHKLALKFSAIGLSIVAMLPGAAGAATDNGTLDAGIHIIQNGCVPAQILVGYLPGLSAGSYSPTALTGGKTITALYDYNCFNGMSWAQLQVSGFSSDPGLNWLTSVTCNGVIRTPYSYTYRGANVSWRFSPLGLSATAGPVSCSITHN